MSLLFFLYNKENSALAFILPRNEGKQLRSLKKKCLHGRKITKPFPPRHFSRKVLRTFATFSFYVSASVPDNHFLLSIVDFHQPTLLFLLSHEYTHSHLRFLLLSCQQVLTRSDVIFQLTSFFPRAVDACEMNIKKFRASFRKK